MYVYDPCVPLLDPEIHCTCSLHASELYMYTAVEPLYEGPLVLKLACDIMAYIYTYTPLLNNYLSI